jgi:hypothetical protein
MGDTATNVFQFVTGSLKFICTSIYQLFTFNFSSKSSMMMKELEQQARDQRMAQELHLKCLQRDLEVAGVFTCPITLHILQQVLSFMHFCARYAS